MMDTTSKEPNTNPIDPLNSPKPKPSQKIPEIEEIQAKMENPNETSITEKTPQPSLHPP